MLIETIQELALRTADVICDLRRHPTDCKVPRPKIIAHRGAWDRQNIENTMQHSSGRELWAPGPSNWTFALLKTMWPWFTMILILSAIAISAYCAICPLKNCGQTFPQFPHLRKF